jgi:hypothetical protein
VKGRKSEGDFSRSSSGLSLGDYAVAASTSFPITILLFFIFCQNAQDDDREIGRSVALHTPYIDMYLTPA